MSSAKNIYLLATIGVERDLDLLPHFIEHYKNLGVLNFEIILSSFDADSDNIKKAVTLLASHSITAREIWITTNWTTGKSDSKLNSIVQSLPEDSWIIRADSDEFHGFPCKVDNFVTTLEQEQCNVVAGSMVDHVAKNWKLAPLQADISIFQQFPVETQVRIGCRKKVLLHKKNIAVTGGHHTVNKTGCTGCEIKIYEKKFPVHHFKWFEGVDKKYTDPNIIAHHAFTKEYDLNYRFIQKNFYFPGNLKNRIRDFFSGYIKRLFSQLK